jgi:hypothetical protein
LILTETSSIAFISSIWYPTRLSATMASYKNVKDIGEGKP